MHLLYFLTTILFLKYSIFVNPKFLKQGKFLKINFDFWELKNMDWIKNTTNSTISLCFPTIKELYSCTIKYTILGERLDSDNTWKC